MMTSGNGPGPDGRNSAVRIMTPGCADGTSRLSRSATGAAARASASGSLRGTKGTLVKKMKKAAVERVIRMLQKSPKRDRIRANSSSTAMDSHHIVVRHPHQGGETTILLM